jgi:hypothetical protein
MLQSMAQNGGNVPFCSVDVRTRAWQVNYVVAMKNHCLTGISLRGMNAEIRDMLRSWWWIGRMRVSILQYIPTDMQNLIIHQKMTLTITDFVSCESDHC